MLSKADLELEKHLAGAICSFVCAEKLQAPIKRCFLLKGLPTGNNLDKENVPIEACGVSMQHQNMCVYTTSR